MKVAFYQWIEYNNNRKLFLFVHENDDGYTFNHWKDKHRQGYSSIRNHNNVKFKLELFY